MHLHAPLFFSPLLVSALPDVSRRASVSGVTTDPSTADGQTFDYIVVGGGLAGMTVAGRLSEDLSKTVLVVETGDDERTNPAVFDILNFGVGVDNQSFSFHWPTDQGRTIIGFVTTPLKTL